MTKSQLTAALASYPNDCEVWLMHTSGKTERFDPLKVVQMTPEGMVLATKQSIHAETIVMETEA